jgi:hypothetical protein
VSPLRCLLLLFAALAFVPRPLLAASAAEDAAVNAKSAEDMLNAGDWEQALIHFRLAYEAVPHPDYLFNMAQCEYQLGQLKEALAHYQQYLDANDARRRTEALEMARMRIKAIHLRQSVFSIYSLPVGADVNIVGPKGAVGRAPSDFRVPSGRYAITVSKPNYVSQTNEVEIGIAESKSLFFQLQPIPGRLQLRNLPASATLYVRGNRARNPYDQQVEPGSYEIYAEANEYRPRREMVTIRAGEWLPLDFRLDYVQRSGRPELIGFWTVAGAVAGTTAVLARLDSPDNAASGSLVAAGGLVGGAAGVLFATAYVPDYIRDNVALFRIGAMSIGAVEGAAVGAALFPKMSFTAAWTGGVLGLGAGAVAGVWLDSKAPNYGRVTVIESASVIGALAGALTVTAVKPRTGARRDYHAKYDPLGVLAGLNLGLGTGLALAYLPDQRSRGPSWKHVLLVDLATAGGAFAGAVATTVNKCLTRPGGGTSGCRFASDQNTARFTLAGGALGLAAGLFLTRNLDRDDHSGPERHQTSLLPLPSVMPVEGRSGPTLVPGLAAQGRF